MTLKDIAKQLTTAVQTVPNLVQILRDGLEQATTEAADINYSTTEQKIGKWTDGKDLYMKVISHDCTNTSDVQDAYAVPSGDTVVLTYGAHFTNSSGAQVYSTFAGTNFWDYIVTSAKISVKRNTNDANWQSNVNFKCVILYTKTA